MKHHERLWESKFESMGEDIMLEVFMKVAQNVKAVIRLRCVSNSWRRLVNSFCLPRLTCNDPLELKGHLLKMEFVGFDINYSPVLAYAPHRCCQGGDDDHHFGQEEEEGPRLLEKIKSEEDRGLVFLDACNGLLLHRLNNNDSSSPPVYRVSNLETNSCVVVHGEADTADSMFNKTDHAALAYDPAESLMSFKIVVFFLRLAGDNEMLHKCIRIYSSKTCKWTPDLNFDHLLDLPIRAHRWLQLSVYLNGAIYRSLRGFYLMRFETDEEGICDERRRAQAIRFPQGAHLFDTHQSIHVGINKGQLSLASALPFYVHYGLKVWVLQEEFHGNNYSYQWIPKHHFRTFELPGFEFTLPHKMPVTCPVGFHPNEDALVIITVDHFKFRFSCYHLLHRKLIKHSVSTSYDFAIRSYADPEEDVGLCPYSYPIFSCAVPLL